MACQSPHRVTKAIANRLAGCSMAESMVKAGYSPSYADSGQAGQFFSRPEIASRMTKALAKARPDVVERAAQAVTDALDATKSVVVYQGKDHPAELVEIPDHDIRLKAADRVVDVFGFVPGKVEVPQQAPPPITVIFSLHGSASATKRVDESRPATKPFTLTLNPSDPRGNVAAVS